MGVVLLNIRTPMALGVTDDCEANFSKTTPILLSHTPLLNLIVMLLGILARCLLNEQGGPPINFD
jgi:hypothetical protein